jgi:hypothetical protein
MLWKKKSEVAAVCCIFLPRSRPFREKSFEKSKSDHMLMAIVMRMQLGT